MNFIKFLQIKLKIYKLIIITIKKWTLLSVGIINYKLQITNYKLQIKILTFKLPRRW